MKTYKDLYNKQTNKFKITQYRIKFKNKTKTKEIVKSINLLINLSKKKI